MKSKGVNLGKAIQRHLSCVILICVYGVLFCASVCGLDRNRTITQFHHTAWTAKEGAPGQIKTLAQTNDGYLWLGTATGLYRFDGVLFELYVPASGDKFPSNNILKLLSSPDGGLWIGFSYGGVSFLKDGHLKNYSEREGLPPGRVQSVAIDDEGTIWAATAGGLARLEGSRWQRIDMGWNYPGKAAQAVFVDGTGTLWVATEETVVFLPKGTKSFQATNERVNQVLQIGQSHDGTMWMAETSRAVRPILLPQTDPQSVGPEIRVGSVAFLFDDEDALWVTSIGDGIRRVPFTNRFRGRTIEQKSTDAEIFTEKDGLSADYGTSILEDREGNVWIGTSNGLDRFRESSLVPVRFPQGFQNYGLAAGNGGDIWTASTNKGVNRIQGDTPIEVSIVTSSTIFRDDEGTIWMSDYVYLHRLRENEFSKIKLPNETNVFGIQIIFKDGDGTLWIYINNQGAFLLKDGDWKPYDRQSELPKSTPIIGSVDSLKRIWFGYAGNKLTVIDGENIRTFSREDGLEVGDVKAVHQRHGHLWVGGTLGLAVFEGDRFRSLMAENTEELNGVSGIVESANGDLWLNTSRGIIHIPAEEARRSLEDASYRIRFRIFDFQDGLPGAGQQGAPYPTAIEGSDGRVWFSTTKGVVWINPKKIPRNTVPPPVQIRSLYAHEKLYEPLSLLALPEGTTRLQINFAALSLSIPERVRFRIRLEGVDNEWQDPGAKREATYTNLGPGTYRFQVIASNNDGVWNEEGAILEFSIAPMFYQTIWFRFLMFLLVLLLLAGIVSLLYRWRLTRATERLNLGFEERLAERTRIAHELHDTLLQGFFGASMRLQAVSNLLPAKSEKAKENLDDVLDQIDVVLEEGRRAIWDMNALSVGENDLGQAFSLVGEDLNKTYPTNFNVTSEGEIRPLHPLIRDQIYRIGREALINAFRHSQATKIELEIEYAPKHLRLVIRDNGCGISPDYLSQGRKGHLGLSGMREYAEKIGAELKIWSRAESGTEVELIVPHQIAFVKTSSIGFPEAVKAFIGGRSNKEKREPPN